MKSVSMLALAGTAAAASYPDFKIPHLSTHQPSGEKFGYYHIDFNVTSENGGSPVTSWCYAWWGDEVAQTPVDKWLPCTTEPGGEENSDVSFKLPQELQIGDFYLALRQNFTETVSGTTTNTIATTDPYHFSNTTSNPQVPYTCTINPYDNGYQYHASGDCATTAPLSLPITNASPACAHAKTVSLSFPIQVRTQWGESIYVVGSIPELGSWDLEKAVPLNADKYSDKPNGDIWSGGDVKVAAGTTFEWKAVQKNVDGSWLWECGDNYVSTVDEFTCGEQVVGNGTPYWFACGDH